MKPYRTKKFQHLGVLMSKDYSCVTDNDAFNMIARPSAVTDQGVHTSCLPIRPRKRTFVMESLQRVLSICLQ